MTAQENKDIVRGIIDLINRKDFEGTMKYFDINAESTIIPREKTYKGPEGFKQLLQLRKNIASETKYDVTNIVSCEDTVVVEYNLKGKNDGPYPIPEGGEFPASGKNIDLKCCDLVNIQNGKVTSWKSYTDLHTVMHQIGFFHEMEHH
ncbi:MAG TPA: ester cyclase [Ignavibacteriales bacterium]|nr:ester cyclase [Ignavibacteriales bacterium]